MLLARCLGLFLLAFGVIFVFPSLVNSLPAPFQANGKPSKDQHGDTVSDETSWGKLVCTFKIVSGCGNGLNGVRDVSVPLGLCQLGKKRKVRKIKKDLHMLKEAYIYFEEERSENSRGWRIILVSENHKFWPF